ncbi:hypothetical protein SISSUDRAFT_1050578 [Sistotremastrum suecicum HHB10207 ss-3]|uniref:Fungal lipase-type domain-containing protein n=1 Tax=Sistotremastrum suecicum HHB10207 ss-3 TaxID=1314776 RepID=A0A166B4K3_9AGAM|nr:hypothetical protein SISSUDRAFT_1050578 [Sistotremastrum suecicum HHB10207 ss-3]
MPSSELSLDFSCLGDGSSLSSSLYESSPPSSVASDVNDINCDLESYYMEEVDQLWRTQQVKNSGEKRHDGLSVKYVRAFLKFTLLSCRRIVWSALFHACGMREFLVVLLFEIGSVSILFVLLIWCLLASAPAFQSVYSRFSAQYCKALSLTNAAYPDMFEELEDSVRESAINALNQSVSQQHYPSAERRFNLDVAKLLLQCSAIMYERYRADEEVHIEVPDARLNPRYPALPNPLVPGALGLSFKTETRTAAISRFANAHGLEYSTVSELNSQGEAFCGLFWSERGNFIILAYRGTAPTDFVEWSTDLSYELREGGTLIRGWDRVHKGFSEKAFPDHMPEGSRSPYDSIKLSVKTLAMHLLSNRLPGTKINVWTTGHSLGAAVASLMFSRQITEPLDFGDEIKFRDAYLFGMPVICNSLSKIAFDHSMKIDRHRTLWRITNGSDIVSTGVPHTGDQPDSKVAPCSPLSFAHLGTSINLGQPGVSSDSCTSSSTEPILLVSAAATTGKQKPTSSTRARAAWIAFAARLPILGRFYSHGTASYWLRLKELRPGAIKAGRLPKS